MPCRSNALVELPESDRAAPVRALAFDAQGRWLMAAGDDKTVNVWHLVGMTLHCQWCAQPNTTILTKMCTIPIQQMQRCVVSGSAPAQGMCNACFPWSTYYVSRISATLIRGSNTGGADIAPP